MFCKRRHSKIFRKIHGKTSVSETLALLFSCEFVEISNRTPFLTEHLWWLFLLYWNIDKNMCTVSKFPWNCSRSIHQEVFLRKGVLKTCSKFTGENPYRSVVLIKMLCNFIEITLRHGFFSNKFGAYFQNTFS